MTPDLPRFVPACASAVLLAACSAASLPASEKVAEAVRAQLPRYDPAWRQAAEAQKTAAGAAESPILKSPEERKPPPPRTVALVVEPNVVQLEPFVVREARPKEKPPRLPRFEVGRARQESVDVSDPFLSPDEVRRRLRKKHSTPVDFFLLNWLFGDGPVRGAEARERYAGELGALAEQIELAAATGATPEEIKQLRELYLQLYLQRPK